MVFESVGIDNLLIVAVLVAIVAFFYSNLGLGGGQLYVPIMVTLFSSLDMTEIVPLSLSFAFVTMLTSTYSHNRKNLVDVRLGLYLAAGGLLGVSAGVLFTTNTGEELVKAAFTVMLVIVATKMIYDIYAKKADNTVSPTEHGRKRLLAGFSVSIITGLLIGSFGIGGGVVSVPLIIYVFKFEPRRAIGTSALMGSILTIAAFVAYMIDKSADGGAQIPYDVVLVLAPVVLVFAFIGSRWGLEKLKTRTVKTIFTCGVYLAAALMIFNILTT